MATAKANDPRAEVAKHRAEIERVRAELEWLDTSWLPPSELKENLAKRVDRWAASAEGEQWSSVHHFANPDARTHADAESQFLRVITNTMNTGAANYSAVHVPMAPMLAWLLGDQLKEMLAKKVDALTYTAGPPAAERPAARKALIEQLAALERAEEAAICAAEEAGMSIGRRADADPAIVLDYDPKGAMPKLGNPARRVGPGAAEAAALG